MAGACDSGCCDCIWKYYSPFVRTSGVLVGAALWAIGITQLMGVDADLFFIYIIFAAFVVSLLELLIFVAPCCDRCCSREGRCYVFWEYMSWLDNWKRAIVYLLLSVFCYIGYTHSLAIVSGAFLDVLAFLYIIRTYRIRPDDDLEPEAGGGQRREGSRTYGRFHNDDARRSMTTPTNGSAANSEASTAPSQIDVQRLEKEMRYPGGDVPISVENPNPFQEQRGLDEDVDPEGDAGLTRYPP